MGPTVERSVMAKAIRWFKGKYDFLSNFAPSAVELDRDDYPTVEHAFQAAKTSDPGRRREIQTSSTPASPNVQEVRSSSARTGKA